jgi:DNA-binding MarR family transcriptional regulator
MPGDQPPSFDAVVADLTIAVGGLIRRLRAEVRESDLNLSEASVVARLEREGPLTTAALARAEAMTPQSMGSLVFQLEKGGLVQRQPHPTDGRQMLVALTPAGLAARHRQQAAKRAWLAAAMQRLDPSEVESLHAAIPLIRRLAEG